MKSKTRTPLNELQPKKLPPNKPISDRTLQSAREMAPARFFAVFAAFSPLATRLWLLLSLAFGLFFIYAYLA